MLVQRRRVAGSRPQLRGAPHPLDRSRRRSLQRTPHTQLPILVVSETRRSPRRQHAAEDPTPRRDGRGSLQAHHPDPTRIRPRKARAPAGDTALRRQRARTALVRDELSDACQRGDDHRDQLVLEASPGLAFLTTAPTQRLAALRSRTPVRWPHQHLLDLSQTRDRNRQRTALPRAVSHFPRAVEPPATKAPVLQTCAPVPFRQRQLRAPLQPFHRGLVQVLPRPPRPALRAASVEQRARSPFRFLLPRVDRTHPIEVLQPSRHKTWLAVHTPPAPGLPALRGRPDTAPAHENPMNGRNPRHLRRCRTRNRRSVPQLPVGVAPPAPHPALPGSRARVRPSHPHFCHVAHPRHADRARPTRRGPVSELAALVGPPASQGPPVQNGARMSIS
jgi:hypothetical protein